MPPPLRCTIGPTGTTCVPIDPKKPGERCYWPPNNGCALPVTSHTFSVGATICRYGAPGGSYGAVPGTEFPKCSLPRDTDCSKYTCYEVTCPVTAESCKIAPWFGQPGGGTQYKFTPPLGSNSCLKVKTGASPSPTPIVKPSATPIVKPSTTPPRNPIPVPKQPTSPPPVGGPKKR